MKLIQTGDRDITVEEVLGTDDLREVSLGRFLEASAFEMIANGELHVEVPVMHRGAVYIIHTCVQGTLPPEDAKTLMENEH